MNLTKEQIESLYKFTQKEQVKWYDLQSELVDHLAKDIEQIWMLNKDLTFEEVKQKAFSKFGKKGFKNIIKNKQKVLNRFYNKLFCKQFKLFFTIPKIFITISLLFTLFFLIRMLNYNIFFIFSLPMLMIMVFLVYSFKNYNQVKRKNKQFLFEDIMINLGSFVLFLNAPFQILATYIIINKQTWNFQMEISYTLTVVVMGIIYYILVFELPPKIRAILVKEHPEYQISN